MRRRPTKPRRDTSQSWSSVDVMGSIPQSPTSTANKVRPQSRDTGFPEPFCAYRNTCLPHPDADISPNATISAEDIPVTRVFSRQRHHLFEKHRRATSYGKITPGMELTMYSDNPAALLGETGSSLSSHVTSTIDLTAMETRSGNGTHEHQQRQTRLSGDGSDSLSGTDGMAGSGGDESPVGPKDLAGAVATKPQLTLPDEDHRQEERRRRSLFRLRRHK